MKRRASELERQVLRRLWDLGGTATINEVLAGWSEGAPPRYTSVLKVLQIMETKGMVGHSRAGRSYRWNAVLKRREATARRFRELLNGFFDGDRLALVNSLIDEMHLTREEVATVRRMMKARARKGGNP